MARQVFLHVGLPKSGTSYLQKLLVANKDRLAESRVLFPGRTWSDQVLAVRDVRNLIDAKSRAHVDGRWQRLVTEVMRWRGTSVISMEWLGSATDEQIERIVASFPRREVHVVFTARDLARTVPAAWQEFMQNQQTWSWEEFLEGVRDPETGAHGGRAFWAQQDLPALLERWARHVPTERIHVVTLPQPGADRDLLWQRFAEVLGIDPHGYTTQGLGGNESLGLESAELMRRVNAHVKQAKVPRRSYNRQFKARLAKDVLAARRASESSLALPPESRAWLEEVAERHISAVAARGVHVVGDLDELRPGEDLGGRQPADISDTELLDTAVAALTSLTMQGRARPPETGSGVPRPRRARRVLGRLRRRMARRKADKDRD
jgi:hypothetical protein